MTLAMMVMKRAASRGLLFLERGEDLDGGGIRLREALQVEADEGVGLGKQELLILERSSAPLLCRSD